ncbi:MAG: lipoprotein [Candidatus Thiodiazotropha sp.]
MHCRPYRLLWLTIALLGALNLLAACGQKGPLYLPPAGEPPGKEQKSDQ